MTIKQYEAVNSASNKEMGIFSMGLIIGILIGIVVGIVLSAVL